jgi:quinol monooxygenase YgiN
MYISITGLRLKGLLSFPRFAWYAVGSMRQAQTAPGNLRADARRIDGVHHTLTVWTDRAAMLAYLRSGAHLRAMRAFHAIATGAVLGYEADVAPEWSEIPAIWQERGRTV